MIISPPFLPARSPGTDEAAYLSEAMRAGSHGHYPVSDKLGWHGGVHLIAPLGPDNTRLPVRAIADGTVAYVRRPTAMPANTDDHALGYNGWTDDGCVVIRHDTAIGSEGESETSVRFFSIHLHLNDILPAVQQGAAIRRKARIGRAGMFEGETGMLHFEIVCDHDNLQRLIGRNTGDLDTGSDGRTDAVFGEMHFKLTALTPVYPRRPPLDQAVGGVGTALGEELFVGIRYEHGNASVTTYRGNATTLGDAITEAGAEYHLYRDAEAIVTAYRTAGAINVPAHSAVYELLRFGRVLGPDALIPTDVPHWRRIRTPAGQGWVNLNAAGVHKFSDADAPHWAGWFLLQDHRDGDSRCSLGVVRDLLDADDDHVTTEAEAHARMRIDAVQRFMHGIVARFPSEWHRGSVAQRWNWLMQEGPNGSGQATYLTRDNFGDFQRYAEALCFLEDADLNIGHVHWHFHPARFIEHFKKCGWLDEDELGQIYTRTDRHTRENYRMDLNKVARKYSYSGAPTRLSHFLGQGAVESTALRSMQEASMAGRLDGEDFHGQRINPASRTPENQLGHWYGAIPAEHDAWFGSTKYNSRGTRIASSYNWRNGNLDDPDAQKYRGRGFKQLTGLINYSRYWVYRGWLDPASFDESWWNDPQYGARNRSGMRMRPPDIDNPQRATETPYNCIDTGGWYLGAERPHTIREMDRDGRSIASEPAERATERAISYAVTRAINGGEIQRDDRLRETRAAKEILL